MSQFPFEKTQSIAFELSNFCNLPHLHAKCPLSIAGKKETLPGYLVGKCLSELRDHQWKGSVIFNQYNEPMLDPRLFLLITETRMFLPESIIALETNGSNMTEQLAKELAEFGNVELHVTLYGTDNEKRAASDWFHENVDIFIPTILGWHTLDDRMGIYDSDAANSGPCYEPLCFVTVTCKGEVSLCCYDWRRTVTFGNLNDKSLADILGSDAVRSFYAELSSGIRTQDVCRRCTRSRGVAA